MSSSGRLRRVGTLVVLIGVVLGSCSSNESGSKTDKTEPNKTRSSSTTSATKTDTGKGTEAPPVATELTSEEICSKLDQAKMTSALGMEIVKVKPNAYDPDDSSECGYVWMQGTDNRTIFIWNWPSDSYYVKDTPRPDPNAMSPEDYQAAMQAYAMDFGRKVKATPEEVFKGRLAENDASKQVSLEVKGGRAVRYSDDGFMSDAYVLAGTRLFQIEMVMDGDDATRLGALTNVAQATIDNLGG